jgi:hypothetical protein
MPGYHTSTGIRIPTRRPRNRSTSRNSSISPDWCSPRRPRRAHQNPPQFSFQADCWRLGAPRPRVPWSGAGRIHIGTARRDLSAKSHSHAPGTDRPQCRAGNPVRSVRCRSSARTRRHLECSTIAGAGRAGPSRLEETAEAGNGNRREAQVRGANGDGDLIGAAALPRATEA